jgi:hypothetical protein
MNAVRFACGWRGISGPCDEELAAPMAITSNSPKTISQTMFFLPPLTEKRRLLT